MFVRNYLPLGLVLVLAGCGTDVPATTTPPPSPSPSVSQPSPTPSVAAKKSLNDLLPTDAELSSTEFKTSGEPVPYIVSENSPLTLITACGEKHSWDKQAKQGLQMHWLTGPNDGTAAQFVARYEGISGTEVITAIKQALTCGKVTSDDLPLTLTGEIPLPTLTGADNQYAFCAQYTRTPVLIHCYLLLSSGDRATIVHQGGHGKDDIARKQKLLTSVAPMFAAALSRS